VRSLDATYPAPEWVIRGRVCPIGGERRRPVTILTYHAVDPSSSSVLSVDPAAFAAQLRWLSRHRRVRPLSRVLGGSAEPRSVALTFDDGLRSVHRHAFPILRSADVPATVFVVTKTLEGGPVDWIDEPWTPAAMTADEILELRRAGVAIGSHSHSHADLTGLSERECLEDLRRSREVLEDLLRERVDVVAYPRGFVNDAVVRAAARAGFRHGLAMSGRRRAGDRLAIPRAGVYRADGTLELVLKSSPLALRVRTGGMYAALFGPGRPSVRPAVR
jgi:peptidoglycan/xylan/chitin deacetylase (PgdA/CDA1 family)